MLFNSEDIAVISNHKVWYNFLIAQSRGWRWVLIVQVFERSKWKYCLRTHLSLYSRVRGSVRACASIKADEWLARWCLIGLSCLKANIPSKNWLMKGISCCRGLIRRRWSMGNVRLGLISQDAIFSSERLVGQWGHPCTKHIIKSCQEYQGQQETI